MTRTDTDIESARQFLINRDGCTGAAGVLGFCLSGGFALPPRPTPCSGSRRSSAST